MTSSASRVAAYRARQREAGAPDVTRKNRKAERKAYNVRKRALGSSRPFVACDGEGAGTDEQGRQLYVLFRIGGSELHTGSRLRTEEILDFICDAPRDAILVGFAFGYDVTMILRDLPVSQQKRLFEPKVFGQGHSPYVWYKDFDIDYLPKQYLKVRRVEIVRDVDGSERRVAIKGSQRTIFETFGFFQKSFLKVLSEFEIGTAAERELIRQSKEQRGGNTWTIGDVERDYCALECRLLADLMERLRDYCTEADIRPRTWSGAGKLASALHSQHETPKAALTEKVVPSEVMNLANMAYYGGRFEITRVGRVEQKVYEYDIRSAYPSAMRDLPCLLHGQWERIGIQEHMFGKNEPSVCMVSFKLRSPKCGSYGHLGALPIRSREGHLFWPVEGGGVYWSCEIESARRRGYEIKVHDGWVFHAGCDCRPFEWVEPLYDYRQSIGASGPGYPIKLGLNSLYGKLAQRKGNGAFANMVWAGLITARTRAKLNDAIGLAASPDAILMLATDALYSLEPLELPLGPWLGNWEQNILEELFIVQPGLYWDPTKRKRKSRGLSGRFFEEPGRTEAFEHAWRDWLAGENSALDHDWPSLAVPVTSFTGLRLALSRNRPETAGVWTNDSRNISFDFRNKRVDHMVSGSAIVTRPKPGGRDCISLPHRDFLAAGGQEPWEQARLMLDDQPDPIDLGPPDWD